MQLKTRDGIACDECCTTFRNDFTYYSLDFRSVMAVGNRRPSRGTILADIVIFAVDLCSMCFDKLKNRIIEQYKIMMVKKHPGTTCEVSGQLLSGDYSYYYVDVTKATIRLTNQPYTCTQCKAQSSTNKTPCKCRNDKFTKIAAVDANNHFLEFSISEAVYKQFVASAERVRQVSDQWSTEAK